VIFTPTHTHTHTHTHGEDNAAAQRSAQELFFLFPSWKAEARVMCTPTKKKTDGKDNAGAQRSAEGASRLEEGTSSCYICVLYICVLIQLYMCPHTTIDVSSYYCTCVLILLCMCPHALVAQGRID
jgi:hypothetical protein